MTARVSNPRKRGPVTGRPRIDRTGEEHPGFTVVGISPRRPLGLLAWVCKCRACGALFDRDTCHIRAYSTLGCGCRRATSLRKRIKDLEAEVDRLRVVLTAKDAKVAS